MDSVPHCPDAGFHEPTAAITKREAKRFDTALVAILFFCLGVLAGAALAFANPAPTCGAFPHIAEP